LIVYSLSARAFRDRAAEAELLAGLPFLDIQLVSRAAFELLVEKIFATDRHCGPKGMIEIIL